MILVAIGLVCGCVWALLWSVLLHFPSAALLAAAATSLTGYLLVVAVMTRIRDELRQVLFTGLATCLVCAGGVFQALGVDALAGLDLVIAGFAWVMVFGRLCEGPRGAHVSDVRGAVHRRTRRVPMTGNCQTARSFLAEDSRDRPLPGQGTPPRIAPLGLDAGPMSVLGLVLMKPWVQDSVEPECEQRIVDALAAEVKARMRSPAGERDRSAATPHEAMLAAALHSDDFARGLLGQALTGPARSSPPPPHAPEAPGIDWVLLAVPDVSEMGDCKNELQGSVETCGLPMYQPEDLSAERVDALASVVDIHEVALGPNLSGVYEDAYVMHAFEQDELELFAAGWSLLRETIEAVRWAGCMVLGPHELAGDFIRLALEGASIQPINILPVNGSNDEDRGMVMSHPRHLDVLFVYRYSHLWVEWRSLFNRDDDGARACAVVAVAGQILHELVHLVGLHAADPTPKKECYPTYMVQNLWYYFAARKFRLEAHGAPSKCCEWLWVETKWGWGGAPLFKEKCVDEEFDQPQGADRARSVLAVLWVLLSPNGLFALLLLRLWNRFGDAVIAAVEAVVEAIVDVAVAVAEVIREIWAWWSGSDGGDGDDGCSEWFCSLCPEFCLNRCTPKRDFDPSDEQNARCIQRIFEAHDAEFQRGNRAEDNIQLGEMPA